MIVVTTPTGDIGGQVLQGLHDLIAKTGVGFRALALPSFMSNLLSQVGAIKSHGMFSDVLSGDRKLPTVATRDIAAVAVELLLDDSWTGQDDVAVLGPEDLSFRPAVLA